MERLNYYLEMLANICGFSSPDSISALGLIVVAMASCVLVYAVYRAIFITIWPGETSANHIKRRILIEEDV